MKKLTLLTAAALTMSSSPGFAAATIDDMTDGSPYYYQADAGTPVAPGVGGAQDVTDSGINHLPAKHGSMSTNKTFRFININEQVLTMIGDGKHGLWRYQDNGTVRYYLKDGATGVDHPDPSDPLALLDANDMGDFVAGLSDAELDDYTPFDYSFGSGDEIYRTFTFGYDFYENNVTDGAVLHDNEGGKASFVDLNIHHPYFGGKYYGHVPIDLAAYYCTMSAPGYAKARAAMDFAFTQPAAGEIGPLGVRAGLDIEENYPRVLRLNQFPDAKTWINTSQTPESAHWQELDTRRTKGEYYIVERPFFNADYLFIVAVFDDRKKHSYIRPDGPYYDAIHYGPGSHGNNGNYSTKLKTNPKFAVNVQKSNGTFRRAGKKKVTANRVYGIHHPKTGGCPAIGGDFGDQYYGSAWPNNYQEITPLCDGVVIDIKLYANLDGATWRDENKNLANNTGAINGDGSTVALGGLTKNYDTTNGAKAGRNDMDFGYFSLPGTDPYLQWSTNPEAFTTTGVEELEFPSANDQVECNGC